MGLNIKPRCSENEQDQAGLRKYLIDLELSITYNIWTMFNMKSSSSSFLRNSKNKYINYKSAPVVILNLRVCLADVLSAHH